MEVNSNDSWKNYPYLLVDINSTMRELNLEKKRIKQMVDLEEVVREELLKEIGTYKSILVKDQSHLNLAT